MYNKNKKKLENQIINRLAQIIERELDRTVAVQLVNRKKAKYADILCFQVIGVCQRDIRDPMTWDSIEPFISKEFGIVIELYIEEDYWADDAAA
jgi:hypothetical protein